MNDEILNLLIKYCTARLDIKNLGNSENNIVIIDKSDLNATVNQPNWFRDDEGKGAVLQSAECILDFKIKCINSGVLNIWFRGIDFRDIKNNKFPIYIDYTNFEVNGQEIFRDHIVVSHDDPYLFNKNVKNDEILEFHLEWKPFNNICEFNQKNSDKQYLEQIELLKEKLTIREDQIKSIPQLCATTLGKSAFDGKIVYRNWLGFNSNRSLMWDLEGYCEDLWFTKYLKHNFPNDDFKINIFGVSNAHDNLEYPMDGKKVLYSGETLNYRYSEMKARFNKYALDFVDFAMGFDFVDDSKYLRFPVWLLFHFSPQVNDEEIENTVEMWNSVSYEKSKEVVSVSSHDLWGVRSMIDNDINEFVEIEYAGAWKNNSSDLKKKFNNNKKEFLKQFRFNLCAENIIDEAYVTEKIFDAIHSDCIPLYAGGNNYLEPEVLNPNAIVRWYADENLNQDSVELFRNLLTDEKSYNEFKEQDKVVKSSEKFIKTKFNELEKHFERLIYY